MCSALDSVQNGEIVYTQDNDNMAPFDIGSVATFSCHDKFVLTGSNRSVCELSNTQGVWSENQPTCECKFYCL